MLPVLLQEQLAAAKEQVQQLEEENDRLRSSQLASTSAFEVGCRRAAGTRSACIARHSWLDH